MMNKIKNHFLKFGPRRFVILTVILLLVLDIVNSVYLRVYWVHKDLSLQIVERLALGQGVALDQVSEQNILEVQTLVNNAFSFFLLIVLVNNLFFYFFYLKKKLWAQGFILFYTLTNSVLAITFLVEGNILGNSWFMYNLSTIFIYLYFYLGVKTLKSETTGATLVYETKAQ